MHNIALPNQRRKLYGRVGYLYSIKMFVYRTEVLSPSASLALNMGDSRTAHSGETQSLHTNSQHNVSANVQMVQAIYAVLEHFQL